MALEFSKHFSRSHDSAGGRSAAATNPEVTGFLFGEELVYSVFANREYRMSQPSLRPQDILVLAKLLSYRSRRPPMAQMGIDLSISSSEIHAALKRLALCRLVSSDADGNRPLLEAVEEFLVHGVKYAFPAKRGEVTRGVPTSYAAPPLNKDIEPGSDLPPVWPFSEGEHRGMSLEPLYKTAPAAALRDKSLYEFLALIDAIRDGRARERKLAAKELSDRIRRYADDRPESDATRKRR